MSPLAQTGRFTRLIDAVWLLGLAAFILAGMPLASFHGDEAMQVYMSHDYVTAFIERDPLRLTVSPPYQIDDDAWLRILNGSVNRYAIGLSWQLAGLNSGMLPPRPGWDWGLDYDTNVQTGHRPVEALLTASRLSSTLFLAGSVWALFGIGWQMGGRALAYLVSGLYAVNPVVLLNGRRAMQEGSFLFFGLLAVLLALIISRRRAEGKHDSAFWWLLLAASSGLTLASKHSGIVLVASAFAWIVLAEIARVFLPLSMQWRGGRGVRSASLLIVILKCALAGIASLALFVALSPSLWNDPAARARDLLEQRAILLDIQVAVNGGQPTTLLQRIEGIITQPFIAPAQHYEVSFWANSAAVTAEIARYMASPLSGLQAGGILGGVLTLLAGIGMATILWRARTWQVGLLAWLAVTLASLLVNPLPWQRYSLPLYPLAALLAGIGMMAVWRWLRHKSPLVRSGNVSDT